MQPCRFTLSLAECFAVALVGGKGANLGRLVRAGFTVPEGFVLTTRAYREAQAARADHDAWQLPVEAVEDVRRTYQMLGAGPVAVRSSATAEDGADASMAGQYETILGVEGEVALFQAILRCWASLATARSRAYLEQHRIDAAGVAMAVVVQRLVAADVAGVLFTTHPHERHRGEMLLEASWGLGEALVAARVQPDSLRLDRETGRVLAAQIGEKQVSLAEQAGAEQPVAETRRRQPCLRGVEVYRLWQLGKQVAEHFGSPQDIEWAIHANEIYLLQTRPITTLGDAPAYEEVVRATQQQLRQQAAAGRGPWVLHNLAESMPHPTPLSWSVFGRFMSGAGGWGNLYRQAGYAPSPAVCRDGFLELIAGRIYMDTARAPELFFESYPFGYDLEDLRYLADASQTRPTVPRGSWSERRAAGRCHAAVQRKLEALAVSFDGQLRDTVFDAFARYTEDAKAWDLGSASAEELIDCWKRHEKEVFETFAPLCLMPSLIVQALEMDLRSYLAEHLWEEDVEALVQEISSGGPTTRTVVSDAELHEVGRGKRSLESWLAAHGHRATGEFDLATPRWREQPEAVRRLAARLADGEDPARRHQCHRHEVSRRTTALRERLPRSARREFDRLVDLVQRYMPFREDSKDYLVRGIDLLRNLAVEAGRRLEVGSDVFFLTREELFDSLRVGYAPYHFIQQRKALYKAEIEVPLPHLIDQVGINSLGHVIAEPPRTGGHAAFPVSSGKAVGPARILSSPAEAGDLGRASILVCQSTDPSWTPLFVHAAGLVLERGGVLSHGAVVARELGLPAVVLPDATQRFREGEELHVDGSRGWVGLANESGVLGGPPLANEPDDRTVPTALIPPAPSRKDRRAATIRNAVAVGWAFFLVVFFVLPESWVRLPTLAGCDVLLWPLVRSLGRPASVAVIASGMALLVLFVQKVCTDNRRLLEAQRRARILRKLASALPDDSPRRAVLLRLAAPVSVRTLSAAMVPVGLLLGFLALPFVWLSERVDPSVASPPAGSAVQVVVLVDGEWREPVRIDTPREVRVDGTTPVSRSLPNLRPTLERLLVLLRQPRASTSEPWELQVVPDLAREQTANDLEAYLAKGIPPQGITWLLRPPQELNGSFPVFVSTPGHPSLGLDVVLGENSPPAALRRKGPAGSPLKEIQVVSPGPKTELAFWRPLAELGAAGSNPVLARLSTFEVSWIWVYLLAYLATLFLVKRGLRIA